MGRGQRRGSAGETAAADTAVVDRGWAGGMRLAVGAAMGAAGTLNLVDWASGGLTWDRALCWAGIGCVLGLVIRPARITAGPGWLEARGLLVARRVRTDRLVAFRRAPGRVEAVLLRDAEGRRVEVDADVLAGTPGLWLLVDQGVADSLAAGTLGRYALDAALLDRVGAGAAMCAYAGDAYAGNADPRARPHV